MDDELLTRRQIKHNAKARLRANGNWGQMMIANLLPWLITVVFTLLSMWAMTTLINKFGVVRMATDPAAFAGYYEQHADTRSSLLKDLILLWFTQGVAFTALDVYRGDLERVHPGKAIMRLFNAQYFLGILAVAIWVTFLTFIGVTAFIIPGILLMFGLTMSYYTYYDGKRTAENGRFGVFAAMGQSWRLMRGFKLDYFVLQLSLIGWYILEAVTCHLFDFMIDPYLQMVDAGYYDNIKAYHQRQAL